jgi:S-DNA-T family DNA segregation ATPase FtsK/SpoIIIE
MNGTDESVNAGLPVPAEPVYDAELVDDASPAPGYVASRSFWQQLRFVPVAFKSQRALKQAARDALTWLLRSPFTFAGAVGRGVVVCVRAWRRWVSGA